MFRRITASLATAALSGAMLAFGSLPAVASTAQTFAIPGIHGISAWGTYARTGSRVRVTVCVMDIARDVYGGAAAGVAYQGGHHQTVSAVVVGYRHSACRTMTSRYTSHLAVDALSGWRDGKVRQVGRVKQVY
jgi:hypothetical protein